MPQLTPGAVVEVAPLRPGPTLTGLVLTADRGRAYVRLDGRDGGWPTCAWLAPERIVGVIPPA